MAKLSKYFALPAPRRRLLREAGWRLTSARAAMALLPFRRLSPTLGAHMLESRETLSVAQQAIATDISWAIATASRNLPIGAVCIHQAIAAKRMLSRRRIPNTLYLGTRKSDGGDIEAHAWVMSGDIPVTGAVEDKSFAVVSTFS